MYILVISVQNLEAIIGTVKYKKLAEGILRYTAAKSGKGKRMVIVKSIPLHDFSETTQMSILHCSEKMALPIISDKDKRHAQGCRKEMSALEQFELKKVLLEIHQLLFRLEEQVLGNKCHAFHTPHQDDTTGCSDCTQIREEEAQTRTSEHNIGRFYRHACPLFDEGLL